MRISDWSSDVCSSDLVLAANLERRAQAVERIDPQTERQFENLARANESDSLWEAMGLVARSPRAIGVITAQSLGMGAKGLLATAGTGGLSRLLTAGVSGLSSGSVEFGATIAEEHERTSVGEGKDVSVRVDLGGRQTLKKTREYNKNKK